MAGTKKRARTYRRLWLCALLLTLAACSSRYRLDLHMVFDDERQNVKVEQTQYVLDAALGDAVTDQRVVAGDGNVAIITAATRGKALAKGKMSVFQFDEYFRCRVYLELPSPPKTGTRDLKGNSFVQILGRYDQSAEEKIFLPVSGSFAVDSVATDNLYMSINGMFRNRSDIPLELDGRLKLKVSE